MTPKREFLGQNVNYLGTLKSALGDLQGIETVVYELIQNADDALGTSRIAFDVRDDALVVSNDGVFRELDFARMREILHGGKSSEAKTTGAFGVGFVSVYQVTDTPQIESNGQRWTFRPTNPDDKRIEIERIGDVEGTRFVLPWASAASATRQALGSEPLTTEQIAMFPERIAYAVRKAALFLKQLFTLTVRQNGKTVLEIRRNVEGDRLTLDNDKTSTVWHLLRGNFAAAAANLQQQHAEITLNRSAEVVVAVPEEATSLRNEGWLYATLPSETRVPLAMCINADFFPTTDRKSVRFGEDELYRGAWNRAALQAAAEALRDAVPQLPALLDAQRWSDLLLQAHQSATIEPWRVVWQTLHPALIEHPTVQTADGVWRLPAETVLAFSVEERAALPALASLGVPVVAETMQAAFGTLRNSEMAVPLLSVAAIEACGRFQKGTHYKAVLSKAESWHSLWRAVEAITVDPQRAEASVGWAKSALAWDSDGYLQRLDTLYRGDVRTRNLFPSVRWLALELENVALFQSQVQQFDLDSALTALESFTADELEMAWRAGQLDVAGLFGWFAEYSRDFDAMSAYQLRRLPLVPVDGQLVALDGLLLPADFRDPLNSAEILNIDTLGGSYIEHLLHNLDIDELTFESWLTNQLPRALADVKSIPTDRLWRTVDVLAQRLGDLYALHDEAALRALPLVGCLDGQFRPAAEVYFDSPAVRDILTTRVHLAEPRSSAVAALYRYLGVKEIAAWDDAVAVLQKIADEADGAVLNAGQQRVVLACWRLLDGALREGTVSAETLSALANDPLILDKRGILTAPANLFFEDQVGLTQHFPQLLAHSVLRRSPHSGRAMQAAGVRWLSSVVQPLLPHALDALPAADFNQRLQARQQQLQRVLTSANNGNDKSLDVMTLLTLSYKMMPELQMRYQLSAFGKLHQSDEQHVSALFSVDTQTLYMADEQAWSIIARELARALRPSNDVGGLASGIRIVLASLDAAAADRELDELGYLRMG